MLDLKNELLKILLHICFHSCKQYAKMSVLNHNQPAVLGEAELRNVLFLLNH